MGVFLLFPSTLLMPVKSYSKTTDKTLTVLDWLPQSPDLNIIDAVWDHLDRERNKVLELCFGWMYQFLMSLRVSTVMGIVRSCIPEFVINW